MRPTGAARAVREVDRLKDLSAVRQDHHGGASRVVPHAEQVALPSDLLRLRLGLQP